MNDCILSKYMLSRWLFLLAIIMLRYTTMAQESVEEPKSFKDDYSIIREIDKKESLIYNCYQGTSMFTLTTEGSSTVEMIIQGYQFSHIHDFEILNGEDVYFCGDLYCWDAQYKQQLKSVYIGHFTMTSFRETELYHSMPVDTVSLLENSGIVQVKKMDVFVDEMGVTHVLLTGLQSIGKWCVVDASPSGEGSWQVNVVSSASSQEVFDDVAIMDSYVVVSMHDVSRQTGKILLFDKYTPSGSVFPNPTVGFVDIELPYTVDGDVLLEWCEENVFVSASHSTNDNAVYISGFNYSTQITTIGLPLANDLSPCSQLKDISYSHQRRDLMLLQYELTGTDTLSVMYSLDSSVLSIPTMQIYGNRYDCETLSSIVNKRYLSGYTFASGHPFDNCYNALYNNYKVLRKYVFQQGLYGNCTTDCKTTYWRYEKPIIVSDGVTPVVSFEKQSEIWEWSKFSVPVDVICH